MKIGLFKALGIFGAGYYIHNTALIPRVLNKRYKNLPTWNEYFHELAINKIDTLVYGRPIHTNKTLKSYKSIKYGGKYNHQSDFKYGEVIGAYKEAIIFSSFFEARDCILHFNEIMDTYGNVTVADLCDLVDTKISFPQESQEYGWTERLDDSYILDNEDYYGYLLDLPYPKKL